MRPVGESEISIGTEVNDDKINNELGNLKSSQVLLPPNLGTSSSTEIVVVHQDMYSQIKCNRNPRLLEKKLVFPKFRIVKRTCNYKISYDN